MGEGTSRLGVTPSLSFAGSHLLFCLASGVTPSFCSGALLVIELKEVSRPLNWRAPPIGAIFWSNYAPAGTPMPHTSHDGTGAADHRTAARTVMNGSASWAD